MSVFTMSFLLEFMQQTALVDENATIPQRLEVKQQYGRHQLV